MLNIAINTFKEIVRNKFLYLIIFFAILFILFSIMLGNLAIGDENKIIVDFGLGMIEIFGIIGVLFVGSQLLFKEIEGKTIFLILSKPITRFDFIFGKFLGFSIVIFLILLLQSVFFAGVLLSKGIQIEEMILFSLLFTFFKIEILLSIVLFLSTFMSNILTILTALLIYLLGHSVNLVMDLAIRLENTFFIYFSKILQIIFPPLEALNIKDYIGGNIIFSNSYLLLNTGYSILYISIIAIFTVIIFNRKNFEG